MTKQRGQSAVEFALMAPLVFGIIFVMIYGGIMFMDYLNYNNYARTMARKVSLAPADERDSIMENYNKYKEEAGVYLVSFYVRTKDDDVVVTVEFRRKDDFMILPKEFDIVYRMRLEDTSTESTQ